MKTIFMYGAVAILAAALTVPALAEQPAVPEGPIKMEYVKKVVTFDHKDHEEIPCGSCHHPVDGKETFEKCATAGCHDKLDQKDKSVNSFYRAMHDKKGKFQSCVACHTEEAKKNPAKKKELTSCNGSSCHPKD